MLNDGLFDGFTSDQHKVQLLISLQITSNVHVMFCYVCVAYLCSSVNCELIQVV